jgi:hypothetical protein
VVLAYNLESIMTAVASNIASLPVPSGFQLLVKYLLARHPGKKKL